MKRYSLDEAKAIVQKLKPILKEIRTKAHEYSKYHIETLRLVANFRSSPYDRDGVLDKIINTRKELRELVLTLENDSIFLRDIESGGVDLPSRVGGEDVMLCHRVFEESEISWWHGVNEPCSARRPLREKDVL